MTSDPQRLNGYVEVWKTAVDNVVELLGGLTDDEWSTPTDLPGWDVRAVAAHLAHIESELSGVEQTKVEVPDLEHLTAPSSLYTESGLIARESLSNKEIVHELLQACNVRLKQLHEHPPTDGSAAPPFTPGGLPWDWERLLRNRPLDIWMHEQDIRRAVGRPGGMNTPGAAHCVIVLTMSFPLSVGKHVAPPAGTTVMLDVRGGHPVHLAVEVNADGRAVPMSHDPDDPTVHLRMGTETFTILGGGRRTPEDLQVEIVGDQDLGRAVLVAMAVTP